jgi:Gram-negative bacterial TonB protein C-terminal
VSSFLILSLVAALAPGGDVPASSADAGVMLREEEISVSIDRELIRQVVRSHLSELRACYEAFLLHPGDAGVALAGKVAVRWVVDPDGSVSKAEVKQASPGFSEKLSGCVTTAVLTWRFPKPRGGGVALVTYPFIFKKPSDAGVH